MSFNTPNDRPLVLALDLDETSGGFINGLRDFLVRKYDVPAEEAFIRYPVPQFYDFADSGWFKDRAEFMTEFHEAEEDGIYLRMEPFEGASDTLNRLVDSGLVIVDVVTAREDKWNADTITWMETHGFPYRDITHTHNKAAITNKDVFIDDSDGQITSLLAADRKVIAFTNPYNTHLTADWRVEHWDEVESAILDARTQLGLDTRVFV